MLCAVAEAPLVWLETGSHASSTADSEPLPPPYATSFFTQFKVNISYIVYIYIYTYLFRYVYTCINMYKFKFILSEYIYK